MMIGGDAATYHEPDIIIWVCGFECCKYLRDCIEQLGIVRVEEISIDTTVQSVGLGLVGEPEGKKSGCGYKYKDDMNIPEPNFRHIALISNRATANTFIT